MKNRNNEVILSLKRHKSRIATRFRGLLPVVIDVETSGLNPVTDALLEIAAVMIRMDVNGKIHPEQTHAYQVEPFVGANLDSEALAITGIDPYSPLRYAVLEEHALRCLFSKINKMLNATGCKRAVLVGHNAWFDLAFIQAAAKRSAISNNPFHSFTTFDTATLAAVALGETVLAKAARAAHIFFDVDQAHSAIYDVERTAELFCYLVNRLVCKS